MVAHQIDPFCEHYLADTECLETDHNDSSLFVMSRALGKVAASPLLFPGVPRRLRGRPSDLLTSEPLRPLRGRKSGQARPAPGVRGTHPRRGA